MASLSKLRNKNHSMPFVCPQIWNYFFLLPQCRSYPAITYKTEWPNNVPFTILQPNTPSTLPTSMEGMTNKKKIIVSQWTILFWQFIFSVNKFPTLQISLGKPQKESFFLLAVPIRPYTPSPPPPSIWTISYGDLDTDLWNRLACLNFGHPAQTSSFTNKKMCTWK